jgi:hypothetical protein
MAKETCNLIATGSYPTKWRGVGLRLRPLLQTAERRDEKFLGL